MIGTFKRFWQDETGPELVEWALVTIILVVATLVLYAAVGRTIGTVLCAIKCWVAKVRDGGNITTLTSRTICDTSTYQCEAGEDAG
ncbi:MAG: hypothetical protein IT332_04725 [Ardenticatenales bacterium]|jgi:Flp pilus assembly pilin Flp|nr:hypothetical protein [Ardenticatenales bacterium]MCC7019032.1 hypothetical protein [Ardenticatenales bacterium]